MRNTVARVLILATALILTAGAVVFALATFTPNISPPIGGIIAGTAGYAVMVLVARYFKKTSLNVH